MTRAATVVRKNDDLKAAYAKVCELEERAQRCSLSDTGKWTNQNVVFTKALVDMFPLARTILKGALLRDEARALGFNDDDLAAWTPPASGNRRGRRPQREAAE